jgi:hypothetical protein
MKTYEPRVGPKWKVEATAAIARLEASAAFRAPLSTPHCGEWTPPGLVTRRFHFKGKGPDVIVDVTLHAKMMVALFKALRKYPTIQVSGTAYGSYRTYASQYALWRAWVNHLPGSHLAANPCFGFHRCGRSVDNYQMTQVEREAWLSVRVGRQGIRVYDLLPEDPPHVTLGERG